MSPAPHFGHYTPLNFFLCCRIQFRWKPSWQRQFASVYHDNLSSLSKREISETERGRELKKKISSQSCKFFFIYIGSGVIDFAKKSLPMNPGYKIGPCTLNIVFNCVQLFWVYWNLNVIDFAKKSLPMNPGYKTGPCILNMVFISVQ